MSPQEILEDFARKTESTAYMATISQRVALRKEDMKEAVGRIEALIAERIAALGDDPLRELHLKGLGLWEEYRDGGCDIFHWMGTTIVDARAEIARLSSENARLREACERWQDSDSSQARS